MESLDDWKSAFPIGRVFSAPLLLSNPKLGPLAFNPDPATRTLLFSSASLSPPALNPPPRLSLNRFIFTSTTPASLNPPSTVSSISSFVAGPHQRDNIASFFRHNRLQLLNYPGGVVVFFSTGSNHDQVGFLLVKVKGGSFDVVGGPDGGVLTANKEMGQRIVRILVNPIEGIFTVGASIIGYLLVYTLYSVHWFRVDVGNEGSEKSRLVYLGCKLFKSCAVAGACWSPHLPKESVVLLEDGSLFLFNLELDCGKYFKGTRLKVSWDGVQDTRACGKWLGCEFSWHARHLVVAHSEGIFVVNWSSGVCQVTCLADIRMLDVYALAKKDRFLAFSKADSSGFHFVLVSDRMLILCDVRKPLFPLLQWVHGLHKPGYVDVFRISELRSNSKDDTHEWATSSGFGIILGSFWTCEFTLFCYGPPLPTFGGSATSENTKTLNTVYAWEFPSELLLSGNKCHCGSCLAREEFWRDTVPGWIDWQQKEDIVLGFGILINDLPSSPLGPAEFGGFTLIRLMSSGNLESQRYNASWNLLRELESVHQESLTCPKHNLLYCLGDEEYKFLRKFKYLKLDYLCAYLNGKAAQVHLNMAKPSKGTQEKDTHSLELHQTLCEKLKLCGFGRFRTAPAISAVFDGISLPTSIYEVAVQKMWSSLPIKFLLLAYSTYSEFLVVLVDQKKVSLEFSDVTDFPQLPPFFLKPPSIRGSKWSQKVQPGDSLVGPVVPLPVLVSIHEFHNGCPDSEDEMGGFSPEVELSSNCNEVMQVAREMAVPDWTIELQEETAISLADDRDDMDINPARPMPFHLHRPKLGLMTTGCHSRAGVGCEDQKHAYLISKVGRKDPVSARSSKLEPVGLELFDDLCPIDLKFDVAAEKFSPNEFKVFNSMKREYSKSLWGFKPHQEFCSQLGIQRQL